MKSKKVVAPLGSQSSILLSQQKSKDQLSN